MVNELNLVDNMIYQSMNILPDKSSAARIPVVGVINTSLTCVPVLYSYSNSSYVLKPSVADLRVQS